MLWKALVRESYLSYVMNGIFFPLCGGQDVQQADQAI